MNSVIGMVQSSYWPRGGKYRGRLVAVTQAEGEHGDYLKWAIELEVDPPGTIAWAFTSTTISPGSLAGRYIQSILGVPLRRGRTILESDLVGREVVATVELLAKDDGSGDQVHRVTDIRSDEPPLAPAADTRARAPEQESPAAADGYEVLRVVTR